MNRSIRSALPNLPQNENEYLSIFYTEISNIMHGSGDCQMPLEESVILMRNIIKHQLSTVISEAMNTVRESSDPESNRLCITHKDIIFLMRNSPNKMMRVLKYLKNLSTSKRAEQSLAACTSDEVKFKADHQIAQFINEMKELYNLPDTFVDDEESLRRVDRADRLSRMYDRDQYAIYSAARQTTFCNYTSEATMARARLMKWLVPNNEVEISATASHVLAFLLHETIARVVDAALLIRREQGLGECAVIRPITPKEINEAMRRYSMPNCVAYGRHSLQPPTPFLIALQ